MLRFLTAGLVLACLTAPASAGGVDEGTPRNPYAWIRNNTGARVRVVISSAYGTFTGYLNAGAEGRLNYVPGDDIDRVMIVFDAKSKQLVANRQIMLKHDHVYDVDKVAYMERERTRNGRREKYKMEVVPGEKRGTGKKEYQKFEGTERK